MNSLDVAHAYLEEHGQVIRTDIVNMGKDLDDAAAEVGNDPRKFRELMFAQAGLRDLPVAYVVDAKGNVKVAALEDERIPYIAPPEHLIRVAERRPCAAADAGQHLPRRGHRQAAQLSGLLSLRGARRQPEGRHASAQHRARRHRVRAAARAPRRPQVRARPDVLHDLADRAAGGRLGRAVVRRPAGGADPASDQRRPAGRQGQSLGAAADPPRRGRSAPPVDEFQYHDAGAGAPAHRPGDGQQPAHGAPPVHGGGAVGRVRRRDRPRSQRTHHARQPLGAEAARS